MTGPAWRELPNKSEAAPLQTRAKDRGKSYTQPEKDEQDVLATGFTVREVGAQVVRAWLLLQAVGLLFQVGLWREVSSHLADFEDVIARECAPEHVHHGICAGPSWNMSKFDQFVLRGSEHHSVDFVTKSSPPTFLLVVSPEPRDVRWKVELRRVQPVQTVPLMSVIRNGQQVLTLEDVSDEANSFVRDHGYVQWEAILSSPGFYRNNVRLESFVEDAASKQLTEVHSNRQCAFGRSWKAFNQQHQGENHRALSRCRILLGIFIFAGAGAVYLVQQGLATGQQESKSFHLVVLAKFVLQDVPQQVCIVLYFFGWYDAAGLRCQLCLFDQQHCSDESAFHFTSFVAVACCLLSALSNQLLIRPARKKKYTEDDICMIYWIRIGGACVATLPFTTGLCMTSDFMVSSPTFVHLFFAFPCACGWISLFGFCCIGIICCCDDDDWD
eukprot:TRINITY_DN80806_c0_g1_i1.p1 TRINITY_DN80806_c0_g1~~TRINITY_DN80806_c0_g1_i1.p1  ORF type:complete len:442 (+),score=58.19 TRINITY_DN80806_c0_g1_i1:87-1412(+)